MRRTKLGLIIALGLGASLTLSACGSNAAPTPTKTVTAVPSASATTSEAAAAASAAQLFYNHLFAYDQTKLTEVGNLIPGAALGGSDSGSLTEADAAKAVTAVEKADPTLPAVLDTSAMSNVQKIRLYAGCLLVANFVQSQHISVKIPASAVKIKNATTATIAGKDVQVLQNGKPYDGSKSGDDAFNLSRNGSDLTMHKVDGAWRVQIKL